MTSGFVGESSRVGPRNRVARVVSSAVLPVASQAEVATIATAIAKSPLVAFDLEFLAQERLVPTLCLVQVSWLPEHQSLDVPAAAIVATPPEVALVDPLAVDVAPLVASLAAHPCVVAHAARQDL